VSEFIVILGAVLIMIGLFRLTITETARENLLRIVAGISFVMAAVAVVNQNLDAAALFMCGAAISFGFLVLAGRRV
jgi:hypothetical protein